MKLALLWLLLAQASHGEVLEDERYRFCHDPRYPLHQEERAWCDLVGDENPYCPELPAACKAGVVAEPEDEGELFRRRPSEAEDDREAKEEQRRLELPSGMSALAKVLFFLLVAVGVGLLLWALFRDRFSDRQAEEASDAPPDEVAPEAAEPSRLVLTDVERLLAEAHRAAAEGRYADAIELAYAAALRRLDGDGLIDMHHASTNGDYLRSLRDHPDLADRMRNLVRDVERVQFGAAEATRGHFDAILGKVVPVATRVVTLIVLLFSTGCDPGAPAEPAAAMGGGFTPSGTRAFIEHLVRAGFTVEHRLERLDAIGEDTAVLVMFPGGGPEEDDWTGVKRWLEGGGLLVLAGVYPSDPALALERVPIEDETSLVPSPEWSWDLEDLELRVPPGPTLAPTLAGAPAQVALTRGAGDDAAAYAIEASVGDGLVIALADPELFLNVAMAVGDNPEAAIFIAEPLRPGKIEVSTVLTGAGAESPMESIHRAKLTPFVLQLLALMALWILHRGMAFGSRRDPDTHRRRAFVDHVRALGLQYARARASGRAAGAYAHWALERLRERLPRGRQRDLDAVASEAALRAGADPQEIAALLRAAQVTSDTEGPPSTARIPGLSGQAPFANEPERIEIVRRLARLVTATRQPRRRS